ncbi:MAG: ABC transporter permease subunit [Gemmatimonadetes bacterium]|nr:ABC transporter permease subunit [Gemmatimonadota bacterium]
MSGPRIRTRFRTRTATLAGIALAGVAAAVALQLDPRDLLRAGSSGTLRRFLGAAFHPAWRSPDSGALLLPDVLAALGRTVEFAAAALGLSVLAGVPLGFAASRSWWENDTHERGRAARIRRAVGPPLTLALRTVIAGMRSVHELIWAMLFLAALGLSFTAAVLAIAIPYAGTLAKVFSEMLDEAPRDAADTLRGAGAPPLATFVLAIIPRAMVDMASYSFYRFECAIRSSAVLGFFGLPTLGYSISLAFENLHYGEVWTYLYGIFALILALQWWSAALRRRDRWA